MLASVERIVRAEATASGAEREPEIRTDHTLPATINDEHATARVTAALQRALGEAAVIDPGMFTGSEDVSWFARDAECLSCSGSGAASTHAVRRGGRRRSASGRTSPPTTRRSSRRRSTRRSRSGVAALSAAAREFLA